MIRGLIIAGTLLLATGCSSKVDTPGGLDNTQIKALAAKVSSYASCTAPSDVLVVGQRVDCNDGSFFIEAYPSAAEMQASLHRNEIPRDLLLGHTWFAQTDAPDELEELHGLLGGSIVHWPA